MSKGSFGSGFIGFILGILTFGVALIFKSKRDQTRLSSGETRGEGLEKYDD